MRLLLLILLLSVPIAAQPSVSKVWVADNRDGTYRNPILHADYSDPDVIRAGDDFYLVASSFNAAPGLPILHSRDLVNWTIIGHALPRQPPLDVFSKPQHGNGVWAPAIRYHNATFYIFYADPVSQILCQNADKGSPERETIRGKVDNNTVWLRVRVEENAVCSFS